MNYKQAIDKIIQRRKNDLILAEQLYIDALRNHDDLRQTDLFIREIQSQKRRGAAIDNSKLDALIAERDSMLGLLGINLYPAPRCARCCDTGTLDGVPCSCVIDSVAASAKSQVSFEESDLSVFDSVDRDYAAKAYQIMQAFCAKFPHTNAKNIILSGGTGTGKTFLASCVAQHLTGKGHSVLFVTAFGFVNRMLGYHTADMGEKLDFLLPLIDCDLLIIDDLGTESRLKNVTVEYLYSVLNERMRLSKHTMVTTNFDKEMLSERYGERIFSRLFDKRTSASIVLAEKDLRV